MSAAITTFDRAAHWSAEALEANPAPALPCVESFRFTMDGDEALEQHLQHVCLEVRDGVINLLPPGKLEGLLLAGGYGRGEGGVLETSGGHLPYNDMEFYVFLRGSTLLNDRLYKARLHHLGERLSKSAGLEVEFKILSLDHLRKGSVSMFSYDFVVGHHWLVGSDDLLQGCEHHRNAESIPIEEATRLLFNRCSGLLFALERLHRDEFAPEDADFVGRNLAKAQLGLGDAILAACGLYHWSCRERHRRLLHLLASPKSCASPAAHVFGELLSSPALSVQLSGAHEAGTAFKLHPRRSTYSRATLEARHQELSSLAWQVWRQMESLRLGREFASPRDYSLSPCNKCPGRPAWRNVLVNARTFGLRGALTGRALRYPRERLFNVLVWLLWHGTEEEDALAYTQEELGVRASDLPGLVKAYEALWHRFN